MTTPEPLPQSELERIKALCEDQEALLKECKSDVRDIVRFSAEALVALPKCGAEIERLKEELKFAQAILAVNDITVFREIEASTAELTKLKIELETIRFNAEAALKGASKYDY